jgi:hypothetical protein
MTPGPRGRIALAAFRSPARDHRLSGDPLGGATMLLSVAIGGDPEIEGLGASLAMLGGNLTGLQPLQSDTAAKHVLLPKEALLSPCRVSLFFGAAGPALRACASRSGLPSPGARWHRSERPQTASRLGLI